MAIDDSPAAQRPEDLPDEKPKKPSSAPAPTNEEPEVTQEESVPTDRRDTEGERLMKEVRNSRLHDKGDAEHQTTGKTDDASGTHQASDGS